MVCYYYGNCTVYYSYGEDWSTGVPHGGPRSGPLQHPDIDFKTGANFFAMRARTYRRRTPFPSLSVNFAIPVAMASR